MRTFYLVLAVLTAPLATMGHAQSSIPKSPVPGAPSGVTAFVNVDVVPMDSERVVPAQTVLVERGWITTIGDAAKVRLPREARRIEGQGKFLIPGLSDCHAHIGGSLGRSTNTALTSDSIAERRLFLLLADGVTTIRNLDYEDDSEDFLVQGRDALRLRARAAAGTFWSPLIYTAGQWAPRQYSRQGWPNKAGRPQPVLDSIPAYVAVYKAAGYDFLKTHNESPAIFVAVLAAARQVGVAVVGHVQGTLEQALAGGMRSIEHLSGYPHADSITPEQVKALAEATARAGTWNCANMQGGGTAAHPATIRALQDAGAGLLLGSDEPLGSGVQRDLEMLVTAGLTPYEALSTGTKNMAKYLGTLDRTGTVAVGKRADLVLLNGNPLLGVDNLKQPAGVMIGGRWLARAEIDRRTAEIQTTGGAGMLGRESQQRKRAASDTAATRPAGP